MHRMTLLALATVATFSAHGQSAAPAGPGLDRPGAGAATQTADGYAEGNVRRVDRDAHKITLRHGTIPNLGMGNMTMVFRVTDPRMLDSVKVGDTIRFKADRIGGQYTVTEIAAAP